MAVVAMALIMPITKKVALCLSVYLHEFLLWCGMTYGGAGGVDGQAGEEVAARAEGHMTVQHFKLKPVVPFSMWFFFFLRYPF